MMEGLIRHAADVDSQITANYTDTHGASPPTILWPGITPEDEPPF